MNGAFNVETFKTDDKMKIAYRSKRPGNARANLLVIHGFGSNSSHYLELSQYFYLRGISVYAIDLRGFGNSRFNLNRLKSFKRFSEDINQLIEIIKETDNNIPTFIIGESLGGLVSLKYVTIYPNNIDGMILVSPALKPFISFKFIYDIFKAVYNHQLELPSPYSIHHIALKKEYIRKIQNDQLYKKNIPIFFGKVLWENQKECFNLASSITLPILIIQSKQDKIIKPKGAHLLYKKVKAMDKSIAFFYKSYHALLNDLEAYKVYELIYKWIDSRLITSFDNQ